MISLMQREKRGETKIMTGKICTNKTGESGHRGGKTLDIVTGGGEESEGFLRGRVKQRGSGVKTGINALKGEEIQRGELCKGDLFPRFSRGTPELVLSVARIRRKSCMTYLVPNYRGRGSNSGGQRSTTNINLGGGRRP